MNTPTVRAVAYVVSCLPADHPRHTDYAIRVEDTGGGLWAVLRPQRCLNIHGEWVSNPRPGRQTGAFRESCRYTDRDTAIRCALAAAPHVTVGGLKPADVLNPGGGTHSYDEL